MRAVPKHFARRGSEIAERKGIADHCAEISILGCIKRHARQMPHGGGGVKVAVPACDDAIPDRLSARP